MTRSWLQAAASVTDKQIELFADQKGGGFFFTSSDHPTLIVRVKDPVDSAIPSGMSVTAENLAYLAAIATKQIRPHYKTQLKSTLQSIAPLMRRASSAAPRSAAALANYLEQLPPPATSHPATLSDCEDENRLCDESYVGETPLTCGNQLQYSSS